MLLDRAENSKWMFEKKLGFVFKSTSTKRFILDKWINRHGIKETLWLLSRLSE